MVDYSDISNTARSTIYFRRGSDEPSRQMARIIGADNFFDNLPSGISFNALEREALELGAGLFFTARQQTVDFLVAKALKEHGIHQIIEIASGYSTHWSKFTGDNCPDIIYVTTDLPEVVRLSSAAAREIQGGTSAKGLYFEAMDAVAEGALLKTCKKYFSVGPVLILSEGLITYLNPEQRQKLVAYNDEVMQAYGGSIWIDGMIPVRPQVEAWTKALPEWREFISLLDRQSARDMSPLFFKDEGAVTTLLEPFDVERVPWYSPDRPVIMNGESFSIAGKNAARAKSILEAIALRQIYVCTKKATS